MTSTAETAEQRRAAAAERLQEYTKRMVDQAPPLTELQRAQLAALLRGAATRAPCG